MVVTASDRNSEERSGRRSHDAVVRVRIDQKGRVVIPADVRERLSLVPGTTLWVEADGDAIRLTPMRRPRRETVEIDGRPVLAPVADLEAADADVRRWRHADQR